MLGCSSVDFQHPEWEQRFPKVVESEAYAVECVLGPGECLFIPRHYWHYIQAIDADTAHSFLQQQSQVGYRDSDLSFPAVPSPQFSFSVSFWWGKRISLEESD